VDTAPGIRYDAAVMRRGKKRLMPDAYGRLRFGARGQAMDKERLRAFLKDTIRREVDFSQTDQNRGLAPPPVEKPCAEQARRIEAAEASHDIVVCDTTPLMTAVYSRQVFGDRSLEAMALDWQRQCHLTLLTALDLPWQADGLQRDGPQVREPVDTALRELLIGAALPFVVIAGQGAARLDAAIDAVTPHLLAGTSGATGLFTRLAVRDAAQPAWAWVCETCDSPDCEHASLKQARARLLQSR